MTKRVASLREAIEKSGLQDGMCISFHHHLRGGDYVLNMVLDVVRSDFDFDSFEEVNPYFKRIINTFKQMNYSEFQSEHFKKFEAEVKDIINERKK